MQEPNIQQNTWNQISKYPASAYWMAAMRMFRPVGAWQTIPVLRDSERFHKPMCQLLKPLQYEAYKTKQLFTWSVTKLSGSQFPSSRLHFIDNYCQSWRKAPVTPQCWGHWGQSFFSLLLFLLVGLDFPHVYPFRLWPRDFEFGPKWHRKMDNSLEHRSQEEEWIWNVLQHSKSVLETCRKQTSGVTESWSNGILNPLCVVVVLWL